MTAAKIPAFEDIDVALATVRITNAGDGLSEALRVAPKAFHIGDECYFVLRGEVTQINHRADKDGIVTRVHTVKADRITEVDEAVAEAMLTKAAEAIEKAKADLQGQDGLFERDDETAFQGRSGVHPTRAELEAEEREAADETDTPNEIAAAAAKRAKGKPAAAPTFSAQPAGGDE